MHIIDIVQNSIKANASKIEIIVKESKKNNYLLFSVDDNGCGMSADMLEKVRNPFTTSRTTRKVGLGIPMLEQTCLQCGGALELKSALGQGTYIEAKMEYNNIDRPPLGDIVNSIFLLLISNLNVSFIYRHIVEEQEYFIDTDEINEVLDGVPLNEPEISAWLKENIEQGLESLTDV